MAHLNNFRKQNGNPLETKLSKGYYDGLDKQIEQVRNREELIKTYTNLIPGLPEQAYLGIVDAIETRFGIEPTRKEATGEDSCTEDVSSVNGRKEWWSEDLEKERLEALTALEEHGPNTFATIVESTERLLEDEDEDEGKNKDVDTDADADDDGEETISCSHHNDDYADEAEHRMQAKQQTSRKIVFRAKDEDKQQTEKKMWTLDEINTLALQEFNKRIQLMTVEIERNNGRMAVIEKHLNRAMRAYRNGEVRSK